MKIYMSQSVCSVHIPLVTITTYKSKMLKVVYEVVYKDSLWDVSYFQNNWEEIQEPIKGEIWNIHLYGSVITESPFNKCQKRLIIIQEEIFELSPKV